MVAFRSQTFRSILSRTRHSWREQACPVALGALTLELPVHEAIASNRQLNRTFKIGSSQGDAALAQARKGCVMGMSVAVSVASLNHSELRTPVIKPGRSAAVGGAMMSEQEHIKRTASLRRLAQKNRSFLKRWQITRQEQSPAPMLNQKHTALSVAISRP